MKGDVLELPSIIDLLEYTKQWKQSEGRVTVVCKLEIQHSSDLIILVHETRYERFLSDYPNVLVQVINSS